MKRYLVFYYSNYYPSGGMKDLVGQFGNLDEATEFINIKLENRNYSMIGHIYDSQTDSIVFNIFEGNEDDLIDFNYEYKFSNCTLS